MPRPKSISDQALLDQTLALMRRVGPDGITFASVAAETGLSGPTLVQRFGSKKALLLAALLRTWDHLDGELARCAAASAQTEEGAIEMLVALAAAYDNHDGHAEGLLVMRDDLRDPQLRERGGAWNQALAAALAAKLADANGPRAELGELMAAQWLGTIIRWGFTRQGMLPERIRDGLRAWQAALGPGR